MKTLKRLLSEMPQLISPTNFGLNSPKKNKAKAEQYLKSNHDEIIRETKDYILFRDGSDKRGMICLVNKNDSIIEYYVDYEFSYTKQLPGVTQVKLWRMITGTYNGGLTQDIFFNYLLKKYNTIISDRQQTKNGRDFWLRQMAFAASKGLHIGLYHEGLKDTNWFDPTKQSIDDWIRSNYGWGKQVGYTDLRYLISTKRKHDE